MKNSKLLKTLSFKVRHQTVLISDPSKNPRRLFITPISCFMSSFNPFFKSFIFSSRAFSFNGINKKQIWGRNNGSRRSLQVQDYKFLTLRSCNCICRKQRKYKIIRPLLEFKRESITMVCKDLLIPIYPDKSNRLLQYSRNRIRKQIIPSIKYFLNPQVEDSLFKMAELLNKEQSV